MAEEDMDKNQQKEFTQIIVKSSNRLLSIVNDVLEISLIESGKIEAHNNIFVLNELMDELFREFRPSVGKDVSFSVNKTLSDELSSITTDEIKLRQAIYNLLSNANKFTENGHIEFGYHLKNEKLEFYVEDTGIGIKQEQQETIFNRFVKFESKLGKLYEGTGLGLAICKGYIKILDGEIWLKSQHGFGSTFYFTVPYVRTKQMENILPDKSKLKINKKFSILVIEDDETNLEFIHAIFSNSGFSLLSARNGKEALSACTKEKKIDLILLDLKLPDMSGYEVLEEIKEILPDIPVIAQTAFAMYEEKKQIIESGFNDFLAKPFKKDQLLSITNKYLPNN
jgi:CheY-like chemotaxis protein